jgi:hypothetical protein
MKALERNEELLRFDPRSGLARSPIRLADF